MNDDNANVEKVRTAEDKLNALKVINNKVRPEFECEFCRLAVHQDHGTLANHLKVCMKDYSEKERELVVAIAKRRHYFQGQLRSIPVGIIQNFTQIPEEQQLIAKFLQDVLCLNLLPNTNCNIRYHVSNSEENFYAKRNRFNQAISYLPDNSKLTQEGDFKSQKCAKKCQISLQQWHERLLRSRQKVFSVIPDQRTQGQEVHNANAAIGACVSAANATDTTDERRSNVASIGAVRQLQQTFPNATPCISAARTTDVAVADRYNATTKVAGARSCTVSQLQPIHYDSVVNAVVPKQTSTPCSLPHSNATATVSVAPVTNRKMDNSCTVAQLQPIHYDSVVNAVVSKQTSTPCSLPHSKATATVSVAPVTDRERDNTHVASTVVPVNDTCNNSKKVAEHVKTAETASNETLISQLINGSLCLEPTDPTVSFSAGNDDSQDTTRATNDNLILQLDASTDTNISTIMSGALQALDDARYMSIEPGHFVSAIGTSDCVQLTQDPCTSTAVDVVVATSADHTWQGVHTAASAVGATSTAAALCTEPMPIMACQPVAADVLVATSANQTGQAVTSTATASCKDALAADVLPTPTPRNNSMRTIMKAIDEKVCTNNKALAECYSSDCDSDRELVGSVHNSFQYRDNYKNRKVQKSGMMSKIKNSITCPVSKCPNSSSNGAVYDFTNHFTKHVRNGEITQDQLDKHLSKFEEVDFSFWQKYLQYLSLKSNSKPRYFICLSNYLARYIYFVKQRMQGTGTYTDGWAIDVPMIIEQHGHVSKFAKWVVEIGLCTKDCMKALEWFATMVRCDPEEFGFEHNEHTSFLIDSFISAVVQGRKFRNRAQHTARLERRTAQLVQAPNKSCVPQCLWQAEGPATEEVWANIKNKGLAPPAKNQDPKRISKYSEQTKQLILLQGILQAILILKHCKRQSIYENLKVWEYENIQKLGDMYLLCVSSHKTGEKACEKVLLTEEEYAKFKWFYDETEASPYFSRSRQVLDEHDMQVVEEKFMEKGNDNSKEEIIRYQKYFFFLPSSGAPPDKGSEKLRRWQDKMTARTNEKYENITADDARTGMTVLANTLYPEIATVDQQEARALSLCTNDYLSHGDKVAKDYYMDAGYRANTVQQWKAMEQMRTTYMKHLKPNSHVLFDSSYSSSSDESSHEETKVAVYVRASTSSDKTGQPTTAAKVAALRQSDKTDLPATASTVAASFVSNTNSSSSSPDETRQQAATNEAVFARASTAFDMTDRPDPAVKSAASFVPTSNSTFPSYETSQQACTMVDLAEASTSCDKKAKPASAVTVDAEATNTSLLPNNASSSSISPEVELQSSRRDNRRKQVAPVRKIRRSSSFVAEPSTAFVAEPSAANSVVRKMRRSSSFVAVPSTAFVAEPSAAVDSNTLDAASNSNVSFPANTNAISSSVSSPELSIAPAHVSTSLDKKVQPALPVTGNLLPEQVNDASSSDASSPDSRKSVTSQSSNCPSIFKQTCDEAQACMKSVAVVLQEAEAGTKENQLPTLPSLVEKEAVLSKPLSSPRKIGSSPIKSVPTEQSGKRKRSADRKSKQRKRRKRRVSTLSVSDSDDDCNAEAVATEKSGKHKLFKPIRSDDLPKRSLSPFKRLKVRQLAHHRSPLASGKSLAGTHQTPPSGLRGVASNAGMPNKASPGNKRITRKQSKIKMLATSSPRLTPESLESSDKEIRNKAQQSFQLFRETQQWPGITTKDCHEGKGLFACKPIKAKSVICNYGGDTYSEAAYSQLKEQSEYGCEYTDDEGIKIIVDPKKHIKIKARYANYSKKHSNADLRKVRDANGNIHLVLVAIRKIAIDEQIVWDYGGKSRLLSPDLNDCVRGCLMCLAKAAKRKGRDAV